MRGGERGRGRGEEAGYGMQRWKSVIMAQWKIYEETALLKEVKTDTQRTY